MKVLITGTSRGIGRAAALKFLSEGFNVTGLDIESDTISKSQDAKNKENYSHFIADISDPSSLPEISDVEILVNNAGIQTPALTGGEKDIQVNLIGTMAVTQKYAFQPKIKSVLFNASVSALTGNEFPSYAVSKAGIIGYMKNCAIRLANSYRATCNALCFGGVLTELNENVIKNNELWQKIPRFSCNRARFKTVHAQFCIFKHAQSIVESAGFVFCREHQSCAVWLLLSQ